MGKNTGDRASRLPRAMRPVFWWLLFVLALFGWHQFRELVERTRLRFAVALPGDLSAYDAVSATLDGKPVADGQRYGVGSHAFMVAGPKVEPFATNFFGWYGGFNLGRINIKRALGTLSVSATPPAATIAITGPEFSTTLTNSGDANLTVPTDAYSVQAQYPHWSQSQRVAVQADQSTACAFAPRLGSLRLTSNRKGATYALQSGDLTLTGEFPATLDGLPAGQYSLTASYHRRQVEKAVAVAASITNAVPVQFILGAVTINSAPSGASVSAANGEYLGTTPLEIGDLPPQAAILNLSLYGYEPAAVTVEVAADLTNDYETNLIAVGYASAMRDGRAAIMAGNFEEAARLAAQALSLMPGDAKALALREESNNRLTVQRQAAEAEQKERREKEAQLRRPREAFAEMCRQNPDSGLFTSHKLETTLPAKAVAAAIAKSLSAEPHPFKVQYSYSPEPGVYEIQAGQMVSLGVLGGTERSCLIVVGQAKPDDTQIFFEVLEYQIQSTIQGNGLLDWRDSKQLIPVSPSRIQLTDILQAQIDEGLKAVWERIHAGIQRGQKSILQPTTVDSPGKQF